MERGDDDGHLDIDPEDSCHPPKVNKKLKKGHNPNPDDLAGPILEEIDIDDKNPFEIQVILDVMFKMMSFEDVKKYRLVSFTWNEVGTVELSRRPQKPINFDDLEEMRLEDKLGELVRLQKSHNLIFPAHQLFARFSIRASSVLQIYRQSQKTNLIIFDNFFELFKPIFIKIYGFLRFHDSYHHNPESSEELKDLGLLFLCKFLVKISPTIQEIYFDNCYIQFNVKKAVELAVIEELTRTRFPHLRKINNILDIKLQKMFFYSIIGQNSPKLNHLSFDSNYFMGIKKTKEQLEALEPILESTELDLMPKLKSLDLLDVSPELLEIFVKLGQSGLLKLTKLNFKNHKNAKSKQVKEIFARLIETQGDSLKILKISMPYQLYEYPRPPSTIRIPRLQNLTFLQIDNMLSFQTFVKPINFSRLFPKLEEFCTIDFDIEAFYEDLLGEGGDSVKSASFLRLNLSNGDNKDFYFDINLVYEIFPNLEFLEIDSVFLKMDFEFEENDPYWSRFRKVRIHFRGLETLDNSKYLGFLKDVKSIEVLVDCGNKVSFEDLYKNCLSNEINNGPYGVTLDHYKREKLYQKYLKLISKQFSSIIHLTSISFIGYRISKNFKRDFRAIFPDCVFVDSKLSK